MTRSHILMNYIKLIKDITGPGAVGLPTGFIINLVHQSRPCSAGTPSSSSSSSSHHHQLWIQYTVNVCVSSWITNAPMKPTFQVHPMFLMVEWEKNKWIVTRIPGIENSRWPLLQDFHYKGAWSRFPLDLQPLCVGRILRRLGDPWSLQSWTGSSSCIYGSSFRLKMTST